MVNTIKGTLGIFSGIMPFEISWIILKKSGDATYFFSEIKTVGF